MSEFNPFVGFLVLLATLGVCIIAMFVIAMLPGIIFEIVILGNKLKRRMFGLPTQWMLMKHQLQITRAIRQNRRRIEQIRGKHGSRGATKTLRQFDRQLVHSRDRATKMARLFWRLSTI